MTSKKEVKEVKEPTLTEMLATSKQINDRIAESNRPMSVDQIVKAVKAR